MSSQSMYWHNQKVQLQQQALQRALMEYLATGQPGQVRSGPFPGDTGTFPTGTSLEEMGFTGELVPPAGPLLASAFQGAMDFGTAPNAQLRQTALAGLASGTQFGFDPALRAEFYEKGFVEPEMQRWREEIMPEIMHLRMPGGQVGAMRHELAQSGEDLSSQLAAIRAGLMRQDEAQLMQLTAQTMPGAIEGLMREETMPISIQAQMGDLGRTIEGQQNMQRFYEMILGQPWGDPRLGLLGLTGASPPGVIQPGGPGLSGLAQLGAGAARLGGTGGLF